MYPVAAMIRRVLPFMALLMPVFAAAASGPADARHFTFFHGKIGYHAVVADLGSGNLAASTYFAPRLTSVWSMIRDKQPLAAVTGTFFAFENQLPVADVVVDGEQKATGYRGSVIAVDWYGNVSILDPEVRRPFDYLQYRYALRGGVRVVRNSQVKPNARAQGFTDPAIWGKARRAGMGVTKQGKIVLIATRQRVSLEGLGKAMLSQGVVDGVSLDGGGSAMLYFNGDIKISPNRKLSTLFMIERRTPFDALFKNRITGISEAMNKPVIPPPLPDER